jgi:hypothetical protein
LFWPFVVWLEVYPSPSDSSLGASHNTSLVCDVAVTATLHHPSCGARLEASHFIQKAALGQVYSEYFGFPRQFLFYQLFQMVPILTERLNNQLKEILVNLLLRREKEIAGKSEIYNANKNEGYGKCRKKERKRKKEDKRQKEAKGRPKLVDNININSE